MTTMTATVQWEHIHQEDGVPVYTQRLRVPGGWLYRSIILYDYNYSTQPCVAVAQTFVPEGDGDDDSTR